MIKRPRRLRHSDSIRKLIAETKINISDLVYPIFVHYGNDIYREIPNLPEQYHISIDRLRSAFKEIVELGISAVILFGIPEKKDEIGSQAYKSDGIVQNAIRLIKKEFPQLAIITDVCLCQYTSHGHCGLINNGEILNDQSLEHLAKTALSHAEAGADMVAPSNMMDGNVKAIRSLLDKEGYTNTAIFSYSAKYASSFYGPFRNAVSSAPSFGDRKTYQMDPPNIREAIKKVRLDIEEGADLLMVKPSMVYLDVIRVIKRHIDIPLAVYNVSGEYSMIKLAAKEGILDERQAVMELTTSLKRAGADIIITYFAKDIAKWLKE